MVTLRWLDDLMWILGSVIWLCKSPSSPAGYLCSVSGLELETKVRKVFTITEKTPTWAFSRLKVELALSHLRIYVQILCLLTVFRYWSLLVGALIKPGEGQSRGLPWLWNLHEHSFPALHSQDRLEPESRDSSWLLIVVTTDLTNTLHYIWFAHQLWDLNCG